MLPTAPIPLALADGRPVLLRPVLPADKPRFVEGWAKLSSDSRYLRFFSPLRDLSADQLRFFTEVDQLHHVAWCALDAANPHFPGVGVGRYVRLPESPAAADFALTVIDSHQRLGVGRILLAALYLTACRAGVQTLRGEVLWQNHRLRTWLLDLGATLVRETDCDVLHLPVPLPDAPTPAAARFRQTVRCLRQALPVPPEP